MPHVTIFIKTHYADLPWLKYCLLSIEKYFQQPYDVIIVADENCNPIPTQHKVYYLPTPENGYIWQQVVKLQAHTYTDSALILFVDSDVIFTVPCSIRDFLFDSQVVHFYEHYSRVGNANCWKEPTEAILKRPITHEYMRRLPILHHRSTLEKLLIFDPTLIPYLKTLKTRRFSEFNVVGAFAHLYNAQYYHWYEITDNDPPPPPVARQFWSWGGITPSIQQELECICGTT